MQTVDAAGLSIGDGHPPRIMGVLNLSAESPYRPSVYDDPDEAADYVESALLAKGADIVDVGLESANKRFEVLTAAQELDRLELAVETVERVGGEAVFSVETRYHEVADEALSRGFDVVNDISGFADPEMPAVCEAHDAAVVKMASPPDLRRPGALETVDDIYDALRRGGLTEKTIVDPAFGGWSEAKTLEDDRETFRRLREFRALGQPILVSINRKNFLKDIAGRDTEGALPVSLAATSMAVERGVHVIRTHDVAETRDAALVGHAFARERVAESDVEELDVTTVAEAERHLAAIGADTDGAPGSVARAVVVRGLDAEERAALEAAGDAAGAVVAPGEEGVYVGGTYPTLLTLADRLSGGSNRLQGLVRAVRHVCE